MKKLVITVAVLACVASMVSAQTVTSANMVGYTKVTAVGGELTLISINFETGGLTIGDVFGDLPVSSYIYLWDKSGNTYISSQKGRSGFSPNPVLDMGDAMWISAAGLGSTEIIISGEVLLAETNVVGTVSQIQATGFYYPVDTVFGDTDLSQQLPTSSYLYLWNGSSYDTYQKGRSGWGDGATAPVGVSDGFWIDPAESFDWSEHRPFTP